MSAGIRRHRRLAFRWALADRAIVGFIVLVALRLLVTGEAFAAAAVVALCVLRLLLRPAEIAARHEAEASGLAAERMALHAEARGRAP